MRISVATVAAVTGGVLAFTLGAIANDEIAIQDPSPTTTVITNLAETLRNDAVPLNRVAAAERLGALGPTAQQVPTLLAALRDRDGYVRSASAGALARIAPERPGVAEAVEALLTDSDLGVRSAAASALGLMGSHARAAVPHLITLLETDDYYGVREASATSLGQIAPGDPVSSSGLLRALNGTSRTPRFDRSAANQRYYFHVQSAAAKALTAFGEPGIAALLDVLAQGGESSNWAAEAMATITDKLDPLLPRLIDVLRSNNDRAIESASWLLSKIGDPAVSMLAALLSDSRQELRTRSRDTLKRIGSPLAQKALDETSSMSCGELQGCHGHRRLVR